MKIEYISDYYDFYILQQQHSLQYNLITDRISNKDNFTMYKIEKTIRSNPSDIIYHIFYYDGIRKHTPLDIAVNSKTNIIEYISFFISDPMEINYDKSDTLFTVHDEYCLLDINECDDNTRYFEVKNKKAKYVYFYENGCIIYLNKIHPNNLNMYYICDFCWLLIGEDNEIYGVGILE